MFGSSSDVNQGTTVGGKRAGRGQSPRSSEEASNDRGAKGGRNVVLGRVGHPSRKGPCSAARLCARMQGDTLPGGGRQPNSGPPGIQVSGAQACAAGATLLKALSRVPEPVHRQPQTGKPDAGEPPVRFGWGATAEAVLYPHHLSSYFFSKRIMASWAGRRDSGHVGPRRPTGRRPPGNVWPVRPDAAGAIPRFGRSLSLTPPFMGGGRRGEGVKTVFNGFGRGAEIRGGVRKPLETAAFSLRRRDTPMNGGVNETARKLITRIAGARAPRRRPPGRLWLA